MNILDSIIDIDNRKFKLLTVNSVPKSEFDLVIIKNELEYHYELIKTDQTKIYYMRDNHSSRRLDENFKIAKQQLEEEFDDNQKFGLLTEEYGSKFIPTVDSNGVFSVFIIEVEHWYKKREEFYSQN